MKHGKWIVCVVLVGLLAGCVTGSAGSGSAEMDQLAAEAAAMGKADLENMVAKYKNLITEKTQVVDGLKAQLKNIPIADMMGEKATALKTELSDSIALISQLKDKLSVYTNALKALQQ